MMNPLALLCRQLRSRIAWKWRTLVLVTTFTLLIILVSNVDRQGNVVSDGEIQHEAGDSLPSRRIRTAGDIQRYMVTLKTPSTSRPGEQYRRQPIERSSLKGYGRVMDECVNYYKAGRTNRSVYLHVLGKDELVHYNDITLVAQMSSERYDKLYSLVNRWSGPISVAVYIKRTTNILKYRKRMQALLAPRKNIALHFVVEKGEFFPVNFLRNVAMNNAATKYVFLTDIDFEPMPQLDLRLQEYIERGFVQEMTALVVPVFEYPSGPVKAFPKDKNELLHMWKESKNIVPFHYNTVNGTETPTKGHIQTDYNRWENSTYPYYVNWAQYYEPYVVTEKAVTPRYWQHYVGRFFNKASQIAELYARGFQFLVLPDVFAVHTPHEVKRHSDVEKRCAARTHLRFQIYLMDTYGWKMPLGFSKKKHERSKK